MRSPSCPRFGYFGHHKCASTWIQYLVHALCQPLALRHCTVPTPSSFGGNLPAYLETHPTDFLCYTNAEPARVAPLLDHMRAFHLIRDPRDMVVSAYFSHRKSHITEGWPELPAMRAELEACDLTTGLIRTIDHLADMPAGGDRLPIWRNLDEWTAVQHPHLLEVRFKDIVAAPYETFVRILDHLGLVERSRFGFKSQVKWLLNHSLRLVSQRTGIAPHLAIARRLPVQVALKICYDNSFVRVSGGRHPGTADPQHHFRRGVPGDWRTYFDDDVVAHFKLRTGDLLIKQGYETDPGWTSDNPFATSADESRVDDALDPAASLPSAGD
ncbi:MAG TPA: hypothetical protein VG710_04200 [Opitutus sp.]|nr:hypothetical protein [Opitutus sp.]